jgi:hypothetical protein
LDVEVPYFSGRCPPAWAQTPSALLKAEQQPMAIDNENDLLARRETLEFLRAPTIAIQIRQFGSGCLS